MAAPAAAISEAEAAVLVTFTEHRSDAVIDRDFITTIFLVPRNYRIELEIASLARKRWPDGVVRPVWTVGRTPSGRFRLYSSVAVFANGEPVALAYLTRAGVVKWHALWPTEVWEEETLCQ